MLPAVGVLGISGNLVVVAVYRCEDDISSPTIALHNTRRCDTMKSSTFLLLLVSLALVDTWVAASLVLDHALVDAWGLTSDLHTRHKTVTLI